MKPALARGDLRTIAATTWAEHKKYFERDAALTRRFQVVKVDEPSESVTVDMLRGLAPKLQAHHNVRILDEALVETVRLARRYIPARQLPDKAVSVLDTACARVGMALTATPAVIENERRRIERAAFATAVLRRELAFGKPHDTTIAVHRRATTPRRRHAFPHSKGAGRTRRRWSDRCRRCANVWSAGTEITDEARAEHARLEGELAALQGDDPLILPAVDRHAVAAVIAAWTGIPVGRMVGDEIRTVLALKERLGARIIGQDQALRRLPRRCGLRARS